MMVEVGRGDWGEAAKKGFLIPAFVPAALVGSEVGEVLFRRGFKSKLVAPFGLEALLLLLFLGCGAAPQGTGEMKPEFPAVHYPIAALPPWRWACRTLPSAASAARARAPSTSPGC